MKLHRATYAELLRAPQWAVKRNAILQRDGHRCRSCGSMASLQVHHKQYHRCKSNNYKLAPWCYDDRHLITLCADCHTSGHRRYRIPTFYL